MALPSLDSAAEPKGEAKVLEIIIVSDAVEGTFVNSDGRRASTTECGNGQKELIGMK